LDSGQLVAGLDRARRVTLAIASQLEFSAAFRQHHAVQAADQLEASM
jgi:hypothetical protein